MSAVHESGPASFGQEQLWLAEQASPGTTVYHSVRVWELLGPLDVAALRAALDWLVERHPALRTTLHPVDSGLRQRVEEPRPVPLPEVVLAPGSDLVAALRADPVVAAVLTETFELGTHLMIRPVLAAIGPQHHVLVLNVHHSACDGWSFQLLRADLTAAYTAFARGAGEPGPAGAGSYLAYAERERVSWSAGGDRLAADWLASLRGLPRPRGPLTPDVREIGGPARVHRFELPEAGFAVLRERAVDAGATVNMALTALFALVLSRWTGLRQVVMTTPVGTRLDAEFERTVGFFANSVPIVIDVGGGPSFAELLGRVRVAVLSAIEHAQVPPAEIRAAVADGHRPVGDPLHAVSFAVEGLSPTDFAFAGLGGREVFLHPGDTTFGLAVRVELGAGVPMVVVEHDAVALRADVVDRFGAHLCESLAALASGTPPVALPPVPAQDARTLIRWSRGPAVPGGPDLPARMWTWVREQPDAIAVRCGADARDYRTVWSAAHRLAAVLRGRGVGAEDLVGVCLPRSPDLVVAVLGVLLAGAAFVPLDPRDPVSRTDLLLFGDRAAALIHGGQCWPPPGAVEPTRWRGAVCTVPPAEPGVGGSTVDTQVPSAVDPDTAAYVIHTSGTTSTPKGVQITHAGLANYLSWAVNSYRLGPGCRVPLHTSVAYDLAVTSLLGPLYAGAEILVLPESAGPMAVADAVDQDLWMIKGTPAHLAVALTADRVSDRNQPAVLVLGGENLPLEYVRQWHGAIPGVRVVNEYGPTETVVGSVAHEVPAGSPGDTAAIGRPIDNTAVSVVDDRLAPVPIGVLGELVIGGAGVARGYLDQPGRTARAFLPDPAGSGARVYRTGDLARWLPDGTLEVVGRVDDQVKVLGYRVEPGEVEAALLATPGVRAAAVVADRRDPKAVRLVGFLCPDGSVASGVLDAVRADLRRRLPAHLVPSSLVVLDELPMTGNGKVDRAGLPMPDERTAPAPVARPRNHWQRVVHDAWCHVLGVAAIGVDVNFFAVGGTSLMLLALEGALRLRGVPGLAVADLFRHPTINDLVERIITAQALDGAARPGPRWQPNRAPRRSVAELRATTAPVADSGDPAGR
ncbi:MAG TPA: amino acid adenylation domain-containing protein [Pseudonocardiaceae bacterium]|nr:amino acid adenylation domain-containing protein [Pseudonocardiaceae bacterium]